MHRILYLSYIALFSILFISCEEPPEDDLIPEDEENMAEDSIATVESYLSNEDRYSIFLELLKNDGEIASIVNDEDKDMTVFAVGNGTITSSLDILGIDSLNSLYLEVVQKIVRYHINANTSLQRSDFSADGIISTLQAESISFNNNSEISSGGINNAIQFLAEEVVVENGVIHEIESLMIPPSIFEEMEASLNTINFPVQYCKKYSQFKEILSNSENFEAASLTEILQNPEVDLTLFLPVNESFSEATIENYDNSQYYFLIANHLLESRIIESELDGAFITKSGIGIMIDENGNITSPVDGEGFEAFISKYNAFNYNNGIIHEIEGLFTNPGIKFSAENIYNTLSNDPQYSDFIDLVAETPSLVAILQNTENITTFIPDNAAFDKIRAALGVENLQQINPDIISALLAYHIHVAAVVRRYEMNESISLSTVQGEEITFNLDGNINTGGADTDVEFIDLATKASNGIIHPIESVLIPPSVYTEITANLGMVSQTILLGAEFSTLATALQKSEEYAQAEGFPSLSEILADPNLSLTMFAPVNQVFAQANLSVQDLSGQEWYELLANHILDIEELRADFIQGNTYQTLAGGTITILASGALDSDYRDGAEATFIEEATDIESINGVVHGIAGILVKPSINISSENIYNTLSNEPDFSDFKDLIDTNPDLEQILTSSDGLTLFAPSNQAFERLRLTLGVETLETINPAIIASVLSFHIHNEGEIRRDDITASTSLSTVQGENITFNANNNIETGGSDNNVEFVGLATQATNGIIHPIESVLIPPVAVFQVIAEHLGKVSQPILLGADFSILGEVVKKADEYAVSNGQTTLKSILADANRSLTVFAPVNEVFEAAAITLDSFTGQEWYGLIANHILEGEYQAEDFQSGNQYNTLTDGQITILPSGGLDSDGNAGAEATIAAADAFIGINGTVHAIAGILVPNSGMR